MISSLRSRVKSFELLLENSHIPMMFGGPDDFRLQVSGSRV
jgi:hypothetical protein